MAKRGALYRCHLFSFGGPQTAGVDADWTVGLVPVGEDEVYPGEILELYARLRGDAVAVRPDSRIRFDILEEDHLLTGGLDDQLVSLVGTGARAPQGFESVGRSTLYLEKPPAEEIHDFVRRYRESRSDFGQTLLIVEDESADTAEIQHHILTWWTVEHRGDWRNAEYYFVLNVDDAFDDQSTTTLEVARPAPETRLARTVWHPRVAARRLHTLLTTSLFDWSVSAEDALQAVDLLRAMPIAQRVEVTRLLWFGERPTKWDRLMNVLVESRARGVDEALRWLLFNATPDYGPIVASDTVHILVRTARDEPHVDADFNASNVALPLIGDIDIANVAPVDAANRVAEAYLDGYLREPIVTITFVQRPSYVGHPMQLATGPRAIEHGSTARADPNDPAVRRWRRRAVFVAYLDGASREDALFANASLRYYRWLDENEDNPEFFTREPSDLWAWALEDVLTPPPPSPLEPYLSLSDTMLRQRRTASPDDARTIGEVNLRYLAWLDENRNALEGAPSPGQIWGRLHAAVVREQIDAETRRALAEARLRPPIDWDRVGLKLDEALEFLADNVWRPSPTYVLEWTEESGGFLGLFEERRAYSSLVQPSEAEGLVRNVIASAYLHDVLERMSRGGALDFDVAADFREWIRERPDLYDGLVIAYQRPRVETREVPIDVPGWQMAIEIGIGFIPIVGQIVAIGELATGQRLLGGQLSTVERGITAASILLPAAGKVYGVSSRALRASRLVDEYGDVMTRGEIDALYRAVLPLRPGSPKHAFLSRTAREVEDGVFVASRENVGEMKKLIDEMGLTDPVTRLRLGLPEGAAIAGARLAPDALTTRFIFEVLEGETAAYRNLSREARDSVRAAAMAEPGFLQRALRAETTQGFQRYRDELVRRMGLHRAPSSQLDELSRSLEELHRVRMVRLANTIPPHASDLVNSLAVRNIADVEGAHLIAGLRQREEAFRRAAETATGVERRRALNNASRLKREREGIEAWLSTRANDSLSDLVRAVGGDANLMRLVLNGGSDMIRKAWIRYNTRSLKVSFPEYVRILSRHYRGNFGEFEVAFRMTNTHLFLKAPDELVTIRGTDLIAVPRGEGPILLIDNKAFSTAQVESVGALTRNLPYNMARDVDELANIARATDLPAQLRGAIDRIRAANAEIQARFGTLSAAALSRPSVQTEIASILERHGIERVVTNAGGRVDNLSTDLREMAIDLIDLN